MTRQFLSRAVTAGLALGVAVALAAGCEPSEGTGDQSFWPTARIYGASEVVPPGTVEELALVSDAVVAGRFTDFCEDRTVQGDAEFDRVQYNCLVLEIDETLSGADLGPSVPVEFLGSGESPDGEVTVPADTVVAFLVDKGGAEAGRYRAVNSYGLWAASDRSALDQPIREEQPRPDEPEVREPLANAADVDDLIVWLRDRL